MLIGKEPADPRFKFLNSKQPLSEMSILQNRQMQIQFKTDVVDRMSNLNIVQDLDNLY